MSDTADTAAPIAEGATITDTAPAFDNAAIMARMDELATSIQSMAPATPEPTGGLADAVGQPFDPYANTTDVTDDEPGYGYDQQQYGDQQAQMAALNQMIQQGVQQALQPMQERQRNDTIRQGAIALEQKYPELADPKVAGPLVQSAAQRAEAMGYSIGLSPAQVAALARDPAFIETTYQAQRAAQYGQQETPADATSTVQLEGSAAQVDTPGEDDIATRIVEAGPSDRYWM